MAKFKIRIVYFNQTEEETVEIEAENSRQALVKCSEIKEKNELMVEDLGKKGIYISKRMQDCRLCRMTLKEELQVCEEALKELTDSKNDI